MGSDSVMARAVRAHDWASTPLGPIEHWPTVLKTTVGLIINSHFPQCIVWGPELIMIPNDAFLPILGNKGPSLGLSFADVWAEAWDEISPIARQAFAGQATYLENFPVVVDRFGQMEEGNFTFCYSPIRDENGTILGMLDTVTETTRMVRAERRQELLNRELSHRLKNIMAVAQAIVSQTIRQSASLDEARQAIADRLHALGRATDILTGTQWEATDLMDLARGALGHHDPARLHLDGPPVKLMARHAIGLSLGLHELATNAIKYGALSNGSGKVELSWRMAPHSTDGEGRFQLHWRESGGPPVLPPERRGFGSTLLERILKATFHGNVEMDFHPDGLSCILDAPLEELSRPDHPTGG